MNESFSGQLNITIGKEDALIEILTKQDEQYYEIIDLDENKQFNLNEEFTFIKISKNYKNKILKFNLNKEGNSTLYIYIS